MLFEFFRVPDEYTERVLRWGIMSALVMRGVMIWIGVAAVQRCRPALLGFAMILLVSSIKMLQPEGEEESLSENRVMRLARWVRATRPWQRATRPWQRALRATRPRQRPARVVRHHHGVSPSAHKRAALARSTAPRLLCPMCG